MVQARRRCQNPLNGIRRVEAYHVEAYHPVTAMKRTIILIAALLLAPSAWLHAAEITLTEPADYQVFQRSSRVASTVRIHGSLQGHSGSGATLEARLLTGKD